MKRLLLLLLLAGCAGAPRQETPTPASPAESTAPQARRPGGYYKDDGPHERVPDNLASIPDAQPRSEPLSRFANRPYEVFGKRYVPLVAAQPFRQRGLASWYGKRFHGQNTSSGERYDMYAMTAAHPTLPIPSYARIRNPANGREVIVRVNDRGPFVSGRIVDLSYTAALKLDLLRGVAPVELERITFDDIRTGAWRGNRAPRNDVDPAAVQLAATTSAAATPPAPSAAAAATPAVQSASPATAVPTQDVALVAATSAAVDAGRFWVQLGAFRARDGAETFRSQLGSDAAARWLEPLLVIVGESAPYRVQAGPYRSRDEADEAAQRARSALAIVPVVVERR